MRESPSISLDESQRVVAEAAPEERLIVTAAAGQGKTEVVLARLESLAEDGVDVQNDVLLLSFSRAAVDTVRRRLRGTGRTSVPVRTFDSFAAQILMDAGEFDSIRGFEPRVRRATEIIAAEETDVEHLEHLVLDESQDLVGDRAEMLLALIGRLPEVGFTVLGDPLQGIYDFQLDEDASISKRTSAEFLQELEDLHGAARVELTEHYRAGTPRTTALIPVGEALRALPQGDDEALVAHRLLDEFRTRPGEGGGRKAGLDRLLGYLDDESDETTAVLAATNYTVLLASEQLDELGVRHVVRRSARDMGVAPWVAMALSDLPRRRHSKATMLDALARVPQAPQDAWRRLKDAEANHVDHTTLDLRQLARRLRGGIVPFDLMPDDFSSVLVSTVHRAKGLEFDNVVDLIPREKSPAGDITWRNLRRKYVAASRARSSFFVVPEPSVDGCGVAFLDNRWVEHRFVGRGKKRPTRMEVLNEDVIALDPVLEGKQAAEVERLTGAGDLLGRTVELVLHGEPSPGTMARYRIELEDGTRLGEMTEGFAHAVAKHLKFRSSAWPVRFHGARIASIETAATEDVELTRSMGQGEGGWWLVPRLTGLVRGDWPSANHDPNRGDDNE